MDDLVIQSHRGPYRVRFGAAFAGLGQGLGEREHLLIDERVAALYAQPLARALQGRSVLRIEATEAHKSLERFPAYVTHLLDRGIKRDHRLIAVGGGIIQDIAAFLAAVLLRGLPWRFYPTTLLAQADSCIGSKSSVNVGGYKNQLGTFTPPDDVQVSIDVLATLPEADIRSGIGEMIKVHIIAGWEATRALAEDYPRLARDPHLLAHAIRRSLEIKRAKVEADEFDQGERLVMNYGHSFGHAIESATAYRIPHGIAVTMGMDIANHLSCRLGLMEPAVDEELHPLLAANYAGFEHVPVPEEAFFTALEKDKKNRGAAVTLILLRGPGRVFRDGYANDAALQAHCREALARVARRSEEPACPSR